MLVNRLTGVPVLTRNQPRYEGNHGDMMSEYWPCLVQTDAVSGVDINSNTSGKQCDSLHLLLLRLCNLILPPHHSDALLCHHMPQDCNPEQRTRDTLDTASEIGLYITASLLVCITTLGFSLTFFV